VWQQSSEHHQDQAIEEVGRRLGAGFKFFRTRRYECAGISHRIATFRHRKSRMELQLIPGGRETMGEDGADFRSLPAYEALVSPILVGRYPIRQGEWDKIGGEDARQFHEKQAPIDSVSWDDVSAWIDKAGAGLRLPTEEEWEFAARAGSQNSRYWGQELDEAYCWYRDNCERPQSVIRHARRGNAFGLVDVLGNVWEWCLNPFEADSIRYPLRGACWFNYDRYVQVAYRFSHSGNQRFPYVGARLVREIPR
ncbi:MAG: formylglycine-generating enzyme family protein, partial [Planctomycetota bacterium]|nr:formylglycine-generating enzyme family protein [Planctomycetota bacterium]